MSHLQRCFAQMHHCFLLRNLEKVKRVRDKLKHNATGHTEAVAMNCANYGRPAIIATKAADVFLAQLNALSTPRSMRTRRLAQAEDNPELTRVARLAYVFKDLYQIVCSAKDEKEELVSTPFMLLPAKKKLPLYYERIQEPIDLTMIEKNITSGLYKTVETFDQDFCRLFNNNVRFFGRTSELGIVAARLRKIYSDAKLSFQIQLEDILGESPPASFLSDKNNISGTSK
jgi:histone-lysine N-methyltransferase ASH1L